MAYFTSLWKARIIEKCRREYEDEKINSIFASNTEIPRKTTSMMQKWRFYRRDTKTRVAGKFKKWFPEGSSVSNLYYYLSTDQTFPNFVLKSVLGFLSGIVLTYLCFMFFVFQLSISLIHATIMSSVIGILLTLGLAFSYRVRCLVLLLIPQLFSRVGRYTLTCYALVLILTGPATNTFKNSEVLSESMACSQEQIKTSVRQMNESMKKPFNAMKDTIKVMLETMKRLTSSVNEITSRISVLTTSVSDVIQSSLSWLNSVGDICNKNFGTPYDYCMKAVKRGVVNCKETFRGDLSWLCSDSASFAAKSACLTVKPYNSICFIADYSTTSFAATMNRKLRLFTDRISRMFFINVKIQHTYTFTSNASDSASQVAAGIVTEIRNRADPLLTWLSWSSCVTSLFLLLIIFRAKYYQHMFETRSRFDNRYVTQELRELDLKRHLEGRETILPLNRREQTKYINVTSFRLVTTEKLYLTRSMVFMMITTFKLLIHIVADYSLYWVLMTIRYHGRFQTILPPGPSDAGVQISGQGIVADLIRSIFNCLTIPLVPKIPSPVTCLPNPHPPDLQRYTQIAVLIILLWFFALFEPYGLRLRHVIIGHYRPQRAKIRAVWLYNHILRTRGSFMKLARRKLHREYKYSNQENLTFRHLINSLIPCWWLRYLLGSLPREPHCLLCNTLEEGNDSDTKLISCKTTNCPGVYCMRCYCDIGHLCTICLSPEDYGDMSDISLETGSSDDGSDHESEVDTYHENNDMLEKSKGRDNEREKLIKKSDSHNKRRYSTAPIEDQVQGEISTYEETDDKIVNGRNYEKQLNKYKANIILIEIKSTKYIVCKKLKEYQNNQNISRIYIQNIKMFYYEYYNHNHIDRKTKIIHNISRKHIGLHHSKINHKAYISKVEDVYIKYSFLVISNRPRYKSNRKRNSRRSRGHFTLKTLFQKFRIVGQLRMFQCSAELFKNMHEFNVYSIKISSTSFHVSKIKSHAIQFNKSKSRYKSYKPTNKIKKKSMRQIFQNQTVDLTAGKYKSCANKDEKCGNKRNYTETNTLPYNKGPNKWINKINNEEEISEDENVCDKYIENIKLSKSNRNTNSFQIRKFYRLCRSCLKTDEHSKDIPKGLLCCCLDNKSNYKRRKKIILENKTEKYSKNYKAREDKNDTRNYRLSSYLSDQSWIWPKFCNQPEYGEIKKEKAFCNVPKVTDQHVNEAQLKIVYKKGLNRNLKKTCTFDVDNHEKNCNKNKNSTPLQSPTKSPILPVSRKVNFYNSLGDQHLGAIDKISEACTTGPEDQNKSILKHKSVPTNESIFASTSKTKTKQHSCHKDKNWRPVDIKSMKIQDIKVALSERFLHIRMKNPLPMMRDLYSTLLEASSKIVKGKYEDKQKETDEKAITVLPVLKSCSCQRFDVNPTCEDRTTQIEKNLTENKQHTRQVKDAAIEVIKHTYTRAVQYEECKDYRGICGEGKKDIKLTKEFGITANPEESTGSSEYVTKSTETLSTISLTEDTKTDTVCSRVGINYDDTPGRLKPRSNVRKIKLNVITKANQGTSTSKAKFCDVSTITSDWWSPIVERKLGRIHLSRGEMSRNRKQENRFYKDISSSTEAKGVTFEKSPAQIITSESGDMLSPLRYLLESQKYYNELFASKYNLYSAYPTNYFKCSKDFDKHWSSKDNTRKGRKTKRLNNKRSPSLKISKSNIDKIRIGNRDNWA